MQTELLLDGFSQVPAEKHQGLVTKAFGVQKTPVFGLCLIQNCTRSSKDCQLAL